MVVSGSSTSMYLLSYLYYHRDGERENQNGIEKNDEVGRHERGWERVRAAQGPKIALMGNKGHFFFISPFLVFLTFH